MKPTEHVRLLLTTIAAAQMCGLRKNTLDKMRLSGTGPAYLKLGRSVRYDLADIEAWISSSRRRSTSENAR
ncbi:MAG: helix-turn-helix domain-containing protein [Methylocella sp.]